MKDLIYLDYAATSPCDPRVVEKMLPYWSDKFGNPNSLHEYGEEVAGALRHAREQIAGLINASYDEVVFTSGATESNRMVLTRARGSKCVVTTKTEHKSVLDAASEAVFVEVGNDGLIDFEKLEKALAEEDTGLVSVCMVNNETGVLQDIQKICRLCHEKNVLVHTDATQAFGKIHINVQDLDVDFLTASGHKVYGPKGIGILYFKKQHYKLLRVRGANNAVEFGVRAGTVPVGLCVGMGEAAEIASNRMGEDYKHIAGLREILIGNVLEKLDEIYINGSDKSFYPGIVNISFRGCEGEALMMEASKICVSSGSACTSNKLTISHVLDAMGVMPDIAQSSVRISIGRYTSEEDIRTAADQLVKAAVKLRAMSPVWEMIKKGIDINSMFNCRRDNHEIQ